VRSRFYSVAKPQAASTFVIHHPSFVIMSPDWHRLHAERRPAPAVVDPRRRLRICFGAFAVLLAVILARAVQLEITQGAAFRAEARQPLRRERSIAGVRGRILARDGTVLAHNRQVLAVAVHYRYLEQPPDGRWLRDTGRRRLSRAERNDPERVMAEQVRVLAERDERARRLAELCGVPPEEWQRRARGVQARVERIAASVNRRRRELAPAPAQTETPAKTWAGRLGCWLREALDDTPAGLPPEAITVAEELDYHVLAEDVPLSLVAEIEGHPERYAGVKVVERTRRVYPSGSLAAHVLGHLGRVTAEEKGTDAIARNGPEGASHKRRRSPFFEDLIGRAGVERQYEPLLRAGRGTAVELTDRNGRILSSFRETEPGVGRDLILTLDPALQRAAETLLDAALDRRDVQGLTPERAGGAIVVMDVHSGALLAAASAPRFDPGVFLFGASRDRAALLEDPGRPLLDRVRQMAVAPGSVIKTVAAAALLQTRAVQPDEPFHCQGYLHEPDRQRCAVYVRHGVGHGDVTLCDALAVSCNVYFFHHAARLGPGPLVDWARRFGFGEPTSVDLPGESSGTLPTPRNIERIEGHPWREGDTLELAVGQGSMTATPLQVARMIAAVANGGNLVSPHVVSRLGLPLEDNGASPPESAEDPIAVPPPRPMPGLDSHTLGMVRRGLERVVADPRGTAHGTVFSDDISIAGKTGTAETAGDRAAHAWFAGYVPADEPRYAIVVALEHAGNAAQSAGPVVKRLVGEMQQGGLLGGPVLVTRRAEATRR
jgi:penicillin-binding protein 2